VIASGTESATGSALLSRSQTRSNRATASPVTNAHRDPVRAQRTLMVCSAEKPAVPKNSSELTSGISRTPPSAHCST